MMQAKPVGGAGARVVRLLQCVAEAGDEFTVTSLAKRLSLAPSTVHRLLQSLVSTEMIERAGAFADAEPVCNGFRDVSFGQHYGLTQRASAGQLRGNG